MSASVLSRTLQSITDIKAQELEKKRRAYEDRKREVLNSTENKDEDSIARVSFLLSILKKNDPSFSTYDNLTNLERWLLQARYNPSVPDAMLDSYEKQIRSSLDFQSRRLNLADLYSRLLAEWLNPSTSVNEEATVDNNSSLDESFEMVENNRLQQLREKFEAVVFTPLETDEVEIDKYLHDLFQGDTHLKALNRMRKGIETYGDRAMENHTPFDERTLRWCIKGLLNNDLLNDEKKTMLQIFLDDAVVLLEMANVLNMRWVDIRNWSWDSGETGMPVEPRRQLNGKFRTMMHEDVLQAILLHYIGMTWSVYIKSTLSDVIRYTSIWKHQTRVAQDDCDRRQYYGLDDGLASGSNLEQERQQTYREDYFLS